MAFEAPGAGGGAARRLRAGARAGGAAGGSGGGAGCGGAAWAELSEAKERKMMNVYIKIQNDKQKGLRSHDFI